MRFYKSFMMKGGISLNPASIIGLNDLKTVTTDCIVTTFTPILSIRTCQQSTTGDGILEF